MLKAGEASTLVVAKLDRATRSLNDFVKMMEQAGKEKWQFVALDNGGIDTTTPYGEAMMNMAAVFARLEARLAGARTKEALQAARDRGVRLGGRRCVPEDVRRRIVAMRSEGATLTAIANTLTEEDVPTGKGGARWYPSTVAALLKTERASAA